MEMGKLIRQARKNANLTQVELAKRAGVCEKIVQKYELGKVTPKLNTLRKIAEACCVPLDYFVQELRPRTQKDRQWPEWIRTAERKPTAEDANEDGCVLSININPGDMNTTNWPWNMVAAFPDCLPVWMPLPKKPDLENLEGAQNE